MKLIWKYLFTLGALLGVAATSQAQQWGDYTLYSTQNSTQTYLLDTNRNIVKTWTHTGYKTGYSSYLAPGGYLYKTIALTGVSFSGGPICGQILKMDWDGNIVWTYTYSTTNYCTHHDFHVMPNGNVLLIAYERHTAAEVAAAGGTFSGEVWSEHISEVKQTGPTTGEVVWQWRFWDHLVQTTDATKPNYATSALLHPELLNINYKSAKDWIHMNGIDYNPILDQVVVSSHNLNEWYVIDHSTTTAQAATHSGGNSGKGGDFLYRWGNPAAYGATGTAVLNVTHDAHWIPEGVPYAGRLVGFNNRGVSTSKSSVDQIDVPITEYSYAFTSGQAYTPSTYTKRHACNGYTSNMGNSQQLPNGNMLVCIALSGLVYEIDSNGTTLWSKTLSGSVPQAFKYSKCYVENAAPDAPVITQSGNTLSTGTADTYQWYRNGVLMSGKTSSSMDVSDSATYVVRITKAPYCDYVYSAGHKSFGGSTTGIQQAQKLAGTEVYPNPATDKLYIQTAIDVNIKSALYDYKGSLILDAGENREILTSGITPGIYILHITDNLGNQVSKKIIINP